MRIRSLLLAPSTMVGAGPIGMTAPAEASPPAVVPGGALAITIDGLT